jgi:hypothetical protein
MISKFIPFPVVFWCILMPAAVGKDYYLSPAGSDSNPGSMEKPWQTLAKAGGFKFQPGDRLLLQGGAEFTGPLVLGADDSGTEGRRVVVTSYARGTASILGGTGRAISSDGCDYVEFRNLKLVGAGRKTGSTASGLYLAHARGSVVDRIEVSGFRGSGVEMLGVRDVRITNVHAHENGFAGISSGGDRSSNVYIADCLAENNPGDPTVRANHSGNGIVVGYTDGAVIERCEARYNGWDMVWNGNGPVGIWTYESDRVVIQQCVSHHNRSTGSDGGGFDLDGGVTNSVVQYNYSHDNYGAGYLICQYEGAGTFENNTVRYNISQDDGVKDHNAGIFVWVGGKAMRSSLVHNNTVYNNKGSAVVIAADAKYAAETPRLDFYGNIFVSLSDQVRGASKGRFGGNSYWSMGERGFRVEGFDSLEKWAAATGQEKSGAKVAGRFADPLLAKDGPGLVNEPGGLAGLHEYRLLPGSPACQAGLELAAAFGLQAGERDFYGNRIGARGPVCAGAHEALGRR